MTDAIEGNGQDKTQPQQPPIDVPEDVPQPTPSPVVPPTPQQTLTPDHVAALMNNCVTCYQTFLNAIRVLPVGDIYKQMGFQSIDTGWLWVKEGVQSTLNEMVRLKNAPAAPTVQ